MKKSEIILKSLWLKGLRIAMRSDIESLAVKYNISSEKIIRYMLKRRNFIYILKGIYYVKDPEELKLGIVKYSGIEMLAEGFRIKGIKNWYLGLTSAIKMLGLTHEVFTYSNILNDRFNRKNPMKIYSNKIKFIKIKTDLFFFGLKKLKTKNRVIIKYSDIEKTVLDNVYLKKKAGWEDGTATSMMVEYEKELNIPKLKRYARHYPFSVRSCLKAI